MDPATTEIYTLSLHDALPICSYEVVNCVISNNTAPSGSAAGGMYISSAAATVTGCTFSTNRSEEHTSELQSHSDLVCRLLLEKKKRFHITRPNSQSDDLRDCR